LLSALLESLPSFSRANERRQQDALSLLVAAYPYLKPWQVKSFASTDTPDKYVTKRKQASHPNEPDKGVGNKESPPKNNTFYYKYLSLLLHPEEGHDTARQDKSLVHEWCILSTSKINGVVRPERLQNFVAIASKENKTWFLYHRDLPMLLHLSMQISDYHIATELVGEIITDPLYCSDLNIISETLSYIRTIALASLECDDDSQSIGSSLDQPFDTSLLRRIILLFHMMATSRLAVCRQSVKVPEELIDLLEHCSEEEEVDIIPTEKEEAFVNLISETAAPSDALLTLNGWENSAQASSVIIPSLRTSLILGARGGMSNEISCTLLQIRQVREEGAGSGDLDDNELNKKRLPNGGIWQSLLRGDVQIDK